MSRTGNLLFPDDEDGAWVTSIIKALPEAKPQTPALTPEQLSIDDPVAIEADAVFAGAAAENAAREAIFAAGWSADVAPSEKTPPRPGEIEALDVAIAHEAGNEFFGVVDDPVGLSADAAFAATAAEVAQRQAIEAAQWSAGTVRAVGKPAATPPDAPLSPEALQALDSVIAREDAGPNFAAVDDPLAAEAAARFAEQAADQAARDALAEAGWSAKPVEPRVTIADAPAPPEDTRELDSLLAYESVRRDLGPIDDAIAARAEARFAEVAAEQATHQAIADAGWWAQPETDADKPTLAELKALDAIVAEEAAADRFAAVEDPVGLAADARFAETAAEVATAEAVHAARLADAVPPVAPMPGAPLSPEEMKTLDEIASRVGDIEARIAAEDPVAIEAEAAFAARAADLAIADAIFAAGWHPRATSADTMVADILRRGRGLQQLEVEDLVRAEAEIAFEDAAYDLAYAAVDSLVTGEAAALAAFDQAIAAGLDPDEALQLAIAAAEEVDPRVFGGLARVATLPLLPGEVGLVRGPTPAEAATAEAPPEAEPRPLDPTAPPAFTVAAVGQGFIAVTGQPLLLGSTGTDTLAAPAFQFPFDPSVITAPGSGFPTREREDLILIPEAARNPVSGSADADFLVGSDGNDAIGGREGDDFIYGDTPTNFVSGVHNAANPLTDPTFGPGGDDFISGGAGADSIWGGPGNDVIDGDVTDEAGLSGIFPFSLGSTTTGDDVIDGGDGDDTIHGGGGADSLYGGTGNDNIFGYAGDDVIVGGRGIDVVAGGAGADEFRFEGGTGAGALAHAQSLGTDVVSDYSDADGDTFGLSDADFGLGTAGTLTDGTDYFEHAAATLSGAPLDASGGAAGPAIVVFGSGAGADGVAIYYTDDASAMTEANSYQIADVEDTNLSQIAAGDFNLRA